MPAPVIPDVYPVALECDRVRLREVGPADAEAALAWAADPVWFRYMAMEPVAGVEVEREFLRGLEAEAHARPRRQYHLGVECKECDALVGMARLGVVDPDQLGGDLGYGLRTDHWGRGIATAAARCIVDFGFTTLGLHRVVAFHDPRNVASCGVMTRIGMRVEGVLRGNLLAHGVWRDSELHAVLAEEWAAPSG